MNAITPITAAENKWDLAQRHADTWRGSMIDCFARAEALVSETLLELHSVPAKGSSVRLQHLTGQRLQDLADAISDSGPFAIPGKPARAHLATLRHLHESWRPFLCHGEGQVALDRHGEWVLALELLVFQGGKPERRSKAMCQATASKTLKQVGKAVHDLACTLGQLRKAAST